MAQLPSLKMFPQRNKQGICNVCRREMSEDGELMPRQEALANMSPNETAGLIARSSETVQIGSNESQDRADSLASTFQILQGTGEGMSASAVESKHVQSTLSPRYGPSLANSEVESISTYIKPYQKMYTEASEVSLAAIEVTLSSMRAVQRAVSMAASRSSEKRFVSRRAQQLHNSIEANRRSGICVDQVFVEYAKTLAAVQEIASQESDALYHFRKTIMEQEAAFVSMIKAADYKHEAFNTVLRTFFKIEEAIDAKYFKEALIFPMKDT